jgi:hypothetical protein
LLPGDALILQLPFDFLVPIICSLERFVFGDPLVGQLCFQGLDRRRSLSKLSLYSLTRSGLLPQSLPRGFEFIGGARIIVVDDTDWNFAILDELAPMNVCVTRRLGTDWGRVAKSKRTSHLCLHCTEAQFVCGLIVHRLVDILLKIERLRIARLSTATEMRLILKESQYRWVT